MTVTIKPSLDLRGDASVFGERLYQHIWTNVWHNIPTITNVGFILTIGTGRCKIRGYDVEITASESYTMVNQANGTVFIFMKLERNVQTEVKRDGTGNFSFTESTASDSEPSLDQILLVKITITAGAISAIDTTVDRRKEDADVWYFRQRAAAPVNPKTEDAKFYVKNVDANNQGLFCLLRKAGAFQEVQVA